MADPGWVEMRHPDLDPDADPAVVTEEAFETYWGTPEKGWVKIDDAPAPVVNRSSRAPSTEGDK